MSVSSPTTLSPTNHYDAASSLRIVVLGYVIRGPIGGMAWHHLQYVLGLHQLGHNVLFIEDSDDYASCYDPSTHQLGTDPSYGIKFATQAFSNLNLGEKWAYYDAHSGHWLGPTCDRAIDFCEQADVLINVSGVNPLRPWYDNIPMRILIDTDPFFTHVRHLTDSAAHRRALQHNAFFSFGELIRSEMSSVPDDGFPWQPTRQPVVLDAWPLVDPPEDGAYTTVMQWDSYPPAEFSGQQYGMKSQSFAAVRDIPRRVGVPLEMALGGAQAPRRQLEQIGWRVVDPLAVTRDPWTYQRYLQSSRGEFSIAKQGYVASRCGWFSERTACYLACGRPAVVQDTGFSSIFPTGRGVWAFADAESAIEGLHQIEQEYRAQCVAARELAVEYFDSQKVLSQLLERAFNAISADHSCGLPLDT
jgi:hypothetical protein